jgi:hypothetical protein
MIGKEVVVALDDDDDEEANDDDDDDEANYDEATIRFDWMVICFDDI